MTSKLPQNLSDNDKELFRIIQELRKALKRFEFQLELGYLSPDGIFHPGESDAQIKLIDHSGKINPGLSERWSVKGSKINHRAARMVDGNRYLTLYLVTGWEGSENVRQLLIAEVHNGLRHTFLLGPLGVCIWSRAQRRFELPPEVRMAVADLLRESRQLMIALQ